MKIYVMNYPKTQDKKYMKQCIKCGGNFETSSRNKRLCNSCREENDCINNRKRVHRCQKKNYYTTGTGNLKGQPSNPIFEIDNILSEMRHLNMI